MYRYMYLCNELHLLYFSKHHINMSHISALWPRVAMKIAHPCFLVYVGEAPRFPPLIGLFVFCCARLKKEISHLSYIARVSKRHYIHEWMDIAITHGDVGVGSRSHRAGATCSCDATARSRHLSEQLLFNVIVEAD